MVVGLFGLSLVMILGGIAAVVQGFPYVRLESGLALVIGGATAASAGTILLGLAAVVMRLTRLERVLATGRAGDAAFIPGTPVEQAPVPVPMPASLPAPEPASIPASPSAGMAGLAGLAVGTAGLRAEPRLDAVSDGRSGSATARTEPRFEEPARREVEPVLPDVLPPAQATTELPAVRSEPERRAAPELAADAGDDLFTPGARDTAPGETARLGETTAETTLEGAEAREAAAAKAGSEAAAPEGTQERVVVGTYASGGNTYVMFADGSIEADTPRGRFTFGSLAELKAFVEAGGESGDTRGAA